ncbi:MFS transporter [uncultured Anaeromusa sp.]|uniref:MFS transporter n=1 Tax=uncultured Anaeromusa sp. TaxID=673273 RepID=UPI0029C726DD|nr:MFS transporter [uncultured Anaeromusa sp.]
MQRRWLLLGASWLVFFVAFLDRVNLSVAMPLIAKDFQLSPEQTGLILSAFFITYTLLQVPGGILGDKIGPKKVMTVALVWWSIMTMATGLTKNFSQLYIVRILFGIGEGVHPPCAFKLNSNWFPNRERATANAIFTSANSLGPAVAPPLAVAIIGAWGWHSIFYIFGILGFLVIPLWIWVVRNAPKEDERISQEELKYIEEGQLETAAVKEDDNGEGLSSVFRNRNTWLLALAYFTFLCTFYGLMTWLPSYLVKARGFEMVKMGIFAGLPFLALGVAQPLGGYISDKILKGRNRKYQVMVSTLIAAPVLFSVVTAQTEAMAMTALVCSGFVLGLAFGPFWALPMECVKRKFAGTSSAVMNTGGNVGGIFAPIAIGYLVGGSGYDAAFTFMVAALVATAAIIFFVKEPERAVAAAMPQNQKAQS